jgi:hypothetical protein
MHLDKITLTLEEAQLDTRFFAQGGIIKANSSMPVPVAVSLAEAEYMGSCNLGAMISHLRELIYEFEYLGSPQYKIDRVFGTTQTITLIDNQATVQMSKNYKLISKNRHIDHRWHFICPGVK